MDSFETANQMSTCRQTATTGFTGTIENFSLAMTVDETAHKHDSLIPNNVITIKEEHEVNDFQKAFDQTSREG